jgi:regulator of replication initiation timing
VVSRKTRNVDFWTKFNDPRVNDLVEATEEYVGETTQEIADLKAQIEELQIELDAMTEDNERLRNGVAKFASAMRVSLEYLMPPSEFSPRRRAPEYHEIEKAIITLQVGLS